MKKFKGQRNYLSRMDTLTVAYGKWRKRFVTVNAQEKTRCHSSRVFLARIQIKVGDLENGHV
jgi:hypothetical protein